MLSLLDLISQNQPLLQTHQALLLIGLQNDFLQPDGRLPVDARNGFLDRIQTLVPKFRDLAAQVIWVQTLYEADRMASDPATGEGDAVVVGGLVDGIESSSDDDDDDVPKGLVPPTAQSRSSRHKKRALDLLKRVSTRKRTAPRDAAQSVAEAEAEEEEELFLRRTLRNGPACLPDTPGADFADIIKPRIASSDTVVQTTNYSAFLGTRLLLILRAKLVTELYICGCMTNVSVLATVVDAARHGIRINVIQDGLGFRKKTRHDEALKRMVDFFDANIVTSQVILDRDPAQNAQQHPPRPGAATQDADDGLGSLVDKLCLDSNGAPTLPPVAGAPPQLSLHAPLNGRQRSQSDASVADSRTTADTKLSDEQFAEMLVQGAKPQTDANQSTPAAKQNLVKSKIRMRSRTSKKEDGKSSKKEDGKKSSKREDEKKADGKKGDEKAAKVDSSKKGEPSTATEPATAQRAESPRQAEPPVAGNPRTVTITKAESSDKLRQPPAKREQKLKSSVSHPVLSTPREARTEPKPSPRAVPPTSSQSKPDSNPPRPDQPVKTAAAKTTTKALKESPDSPVYSAKTTPMGKKVQSLATLPVLRPGDRIAEGDSRIIYDFFPSDFRHSSDASQLLRDVIFNQLYNEVRWQKMLHQQGEVPRLVCCQGEFGADGSMPVYRHPTDQALPLLHCSPKVELIRKQAEKLAGHPLNHVLIQLYRSGQDYISEHSDKTLDIVRGSSIVNVSFGAQRTMRLRTKRAAKADDATDAARRETQRVVMPHNSMFVLGLESNKRWLHGINADKRLETERSEEERAYAGMRISLTFRHIGTFLDAENSTIWGQGAVSKKQSSPQDVINDDEDENEKMVRAFSKENHSSDFDWDEHYGNGFDVLHFRNAPEDVPILFASSSSAETKMVQSFLWETKINHILLDSPSLDKGHALDRPVCYRDNDVNHTEVAIAVPVLLYLDRYHPMDRDDRGRACSSNSYAIFVVVSALLKFWTNRHVPANFTEFVKTLESLEEQHSRGPGPFIAGRRFSIGDCAAWPVLDELIPNWDSWTEDKYPHLTEYYRMLWKKKKCIGKHRTELPELKRSAAEKKEAE